MIALQLYSLKEIEEENFEKVLEMTRDAGYDSVEFAGYFGYEAQEMKKLLNKYKLAPLSAHVGIERLENHFEEELEYAKEIGIKMIVCPYLELANYDDIVSSAKILERCASLACEKGIMVGYHNHEHEFERIGKMYKLDILFENAPSLMLEPDLFWMAYAKVDPLTYIAPYAICNSICAVHAKEIGENLKDNVYVGDGLIDFDSIMDVVNPYYIPYIVEQEEYTTDYFEGIKRSYEGLKRVIEL